MGFEDEKGTTFKIQRKCIESLPIELSNGTAKKMMKKLSMVKVLV